MRNSRNYEKALKTMRKVLLIKRKVTKRESS